MTDLLGWSLVAAGVAFDVVGCVGLLRLPDLYSRMQASTKCVALDTPSGWTKGTLCLTFLFMTSPTGSHALARAAHRSGTPLWQGSAADRLAEDEEGRR